MMAEMSLRTFVVYVEDKPGVLNRVASLFRRRNFNIHSLNVGTTHEPGVSRMTIVVEADADKARRIEANLYKLVNCLYVDDITDVDSVNRVLALIKVGVSAADRAEVLQILDVFRARALDVSPTSLIVEVSGSQGKIDGLVTTLRPYGILEMVQTGTLSMTRGNAARDAGPPTIKAQPTRAA
ncbi:MAG: acetolactate synthase small subunit [Myxococcales bacterium]|jgi:acetolactate synthase-1/3 small subunit|nr:acetolactate synthase small subunit [Myxococcales bacterium]